MINEDLVRRNEILEEMLVSSGDENHGMQFFCSFDNASVL